MDKSKEISDLLDYGIDISIEDCNVEDFLWGCFSDKEGPIPKASIIQIAGAIEAACWFNGKWCIKTDGRLVRCANEIKVDNFIKISLNPIEPESSICALLYFCKIQKNVNYEKKNFSVSMSRFTIKVDEDGFYLPQIRHDFLSERVKSALL